MLQVLRRGQRWVMAVVVIALAGGMVFFLAVGRGGSLFGKPDHIAVSVGGRHYDFRDLERVKEQQVAEYRRALGDSFDAAGASEYLDQLAAGALVREGVFAAEGERLGLRVGQEEMRALLRSVPGGTGPDGKLDRTAWTERAESNYGSLARFESALRDSLLAQKVVNLMDESISISDAEVRDILRRGGETVEVAYVAIDPKTLAKSQKIDDAAVQALLASDLPRVQQAYDGRKADFDHPEAVHARHILVPIAKLTDTDPAQADADALAQAKQVAARLAKGESFDKLAKEVSADQGTKDKGGDLGFFERGKMVPAFEVAAFALEPGKLSEPVKSPYGYHIIRVEEKRPAQVIPFDEAKNAVARDLLAEEKGRSDADALVAKLQEAIRDGKSLVDAARERGLTLERPSGFHRRADGVMPPLGTSKEALAAIFTLSDEKPTLPRVFEIGGKHVLFQRIGGKRPSDEDLNAQLVRARQQLLQQRRQEMQSSWFETRRAELEKSGDLYINLKPKERSSQ